MANKEKIAGKQTRNSSVKYSRPNQEEKSNNNNQHNTKRTYATTLRSNRTAEQRNQTETIKNKTAAR